MTEAEAVAQPLQPTDVILIVLIAFVVLYLLPRQVYCLENLCKCCSCSFIVRSAQRQVAQAHELLLLGASLLPWCHQQPERRVLWQAHMRGRCNAPAHVPGKACAARHALHHSRCGLSSFLQPAHQHNKMQLLLGRIAPREGRAKACVGTLLGAGA